MSLLQSIQSYTVSIYFFCKHLYATYSFSFDPHKANQSFDNKYMEDVYKFSIFLLIFLNKEKLQVLILY